MILNLFEKVLNAEYTHTEKERVSYASKISGGVLTILFEESNGRRDWKNNFAFPAKPYRDMEDKWHCHGGFLRAWKDVEPFLQDQIMDKAVHTIRIAGYSHGAAVALLCHEYCRFHRPDCAVMGCGYGCPRVIWGRLRKAVKERLLGFVVIRNKGDLVTHVPPAILGYKHSSTVLTIGGHTHYGMINAHRHESYFIELKRSERP